jgi:hypothetical protein
VKSNTGKARLKPESKDDLKYLRGLIRDLCLSDWYCRVAEECASRFANSAQGRLSAATSLRGRQRLCLDFACVSRGLFFPAQPCSVAPRDCNPNEAPTSQDIEAGNE